MPFLVKLITDTNLRSKKKRKAKIITLRSGDVLSRMRASGYSKSLQ